MLPMISFRVGWKLRAGAAVFLASSLLSGCGGCRGKKAPPPKPTAKAAAPASTSKVNIDALDMDNVVDDLGLWAEVKPDEGTAPLTVKFTVESLVVDEIPGPQYLWDFGDGSPRSHEASPTHTYEKPGDYTAKVAVVDGYGKTGWDDMEIEVSAKGEE